MILSDNETKVDMLNNRAIAKTVVELINESKEKPISIGIHGDWGICCKIKIPNVANAKSRKLQVEIP